MLIIVIYFTRHRHASIILTANCLYLKLLSLCLLKINQEVVFYAI